MAAFVDVDFTKCPQYIAGYTPTDKPRTFGAFEDSFEIIPEKDWRELAEAIKADGGGMSRLVTRIYNQSNEGSCVGNAGAQAHEVMQAALAGRDAVVPMSAISLYKQIGRSANSGANVGDCIDRMGDTGILPLDTPENRTRFKHVMSHTGFNQRFPEGWKDTAAIFSGVEGYACTSVAEVVTALLRRMCVQVGRAGHSILYLEPVYDGGQLFIDYVNSWGNWGFGKGHFDAGFGRDSARYYREASDWAYAFQAPDSSKWSYLFQ